MVYVFLANGFEEVEALSTVDILRRAGQEVLTVGVGGREIVGAHHIPVTADVSEADLNMAQRPADMVVLPGGMPGTLHLERSATVRAAVNDCVRRGKYLAAICAAPSVLGHWGLLNGHTATCFPGFEKDLHCTVSKESVVQSGNVITARGAGVAVDFALKLTAVLCGPEKAKEVKESIQCV
ncbi:MULTISPECIES: DJ-1 family glyoxalase III [Caproicibacterium]|jgi:4-methyl-5(b-hydroxyethyl)-thiazole monophosphate biosynthesis|uniref:DJ-1 family protein n=1 Tax=Caproicibacterium lactatifermentans TaxID=2666138 RepID=A0A859DVJ4_9FIRM|nr:DJ-1 family glyoxalase III [Caproicibacterium lactatifermentans]ARP49926.1 DJ-1 family protein [Ruminococcaceae bacterium CPB6]MDD4807740.1 DJ-1/PfpI family protein [Oscillospiraceae bacterium]QKN24353.1 DJ-1 family protein [Caproicibacterium lactatifermentans]QKO30634.1 DJ-1 family protein [Caproicibacterium lactatifermentans]